MERITYLLGAGFSAPLGLPVMSNFIAKSKELYFDNPEKYKHFKVVMDTIHDMAYIKNFCKVDLTNIEEILSMLEMSNYIINKSIKEEFVKYIKDVIMGYTNIEDFKAETPIQTTYYDTKIFRGEGLIESYAYFVSHIFRLKFINNGMGWSYDGQFDDKNIKYSIITLNYDMVLEKILENICKHLSISNYLNFNIDCYDKEWMQPHLEKLHGCVSTENIIPPTWAKGTKNNEKIQRIWDNSYKILQDSSQIRIIGYSLPVSDAYIKYLLKISIMKNDRLKKIDVITLDNTEEIKNRYDTFFEQNNYRFKNGDIKDYLNKLDIYYPENNGELLMNQLENVHEQFMNKDNIIYQGI